MHFIPNQEQLCIRFLHSSKWTSFFYIGRVQKDPLTLSFNEQIRENDKIWPVRQEGSVGQVENVVQVKEVGQVGQVGQKMRISQKARVAPIADFETSRSFSFRRFSDYSAGYIVVLKHTNENILTRLENTKRCHVEQRFWSDLQFKFSWDNSQNCGMHNLFRKRRWLWATGHWFWNELPLFSFIVTNVW